MAVTAQKIDGWAIEHTNIGTIKLSNLGSQLTRVVVVLHAREQADQPKLAALLNGFAQKIQSKFQTTVS